MCIRDRSKALRLLADFGTTIIHTSMPPDEEARLRAFLAAAEE